MNTPNASKSSSDPEPRNGARLRRVALAARALAPIVREWIETERAADVKMDGWERHHNDSQLGAARRAIDNAAASLEAAIVRSRTERGGRPLTKAATAALPEHRAFLGACKTWETIRSEHKFPDEYADRFAYLADASDLARRVARHARGLARSAGPDHALAADFVALRYAAENYAGEALGTAWPLLVARLAAASAPIPAAHVDADDDAPDEIVAAPVSFADAARRLERECPWQFSEGLTRGQVRAAVNAAEKKRASGVSAARLPTLGRLRRLKSGVSLRSLERLIAYLTRTRDTEAAVVRESVRAQTRTNAHAAVT